jgi:hypothetical protein
MDLGDSTYPSVIPHVKSGRLTLLAVVEHQTQQAVARGANHSRVGRAGLRSGQLAGPVCTARAAASNTQGAEADHIGLDQFAAFVRKDHARWKQIIEKNQIRGE